MEELEKLYEIVKKQIGKCTDELERDGGHIPANDAEYLDALTHTLKSVKTTLAMEGHGESERRGRDSMGRFTSREGGSYGDGYSRGYYPMYAYEDGEGRSMRGDEVREHMRSMMRSTDDERVRRALEEAMRKM